MVFDQMGVIHSIEMITGQNKNILSICDLYFKQLFADCVCRALIPIDAGECLLSGQDLHPTIMEEIEVISL